jgi:uncharacterized protein YaiI (UPF0178 family)
MLTVYVDADACPVKNETYRVAERYDLPVFVVANSWMRTPSRAGLELVVVKGDFDAADDWIVERVEAGDIVITADIPLASRCLEKGAAVLGNRGREFTPDSIGDALASRELMSQLRDMGEVGGGPPPLGPRDRSQFLQKLDQIVHRLRREAG